jgi:hypothetical protein
MCENKLKLEIRSEEYRSLNEEHKKNREYIFKRPLLIATLIAGLAQYIINIEPEATQTTQVMKIITLLFLSYLLYYNLAFTVKKLRSDARIIAYIQVYHENCSEHWMGWETSLRNYRFWVKKKGKGLQEWLNDEAQKKYVHAENWFYIQIYRFHAIFIFYLLVMCGAIAYNMISFKPIEPIEALIIIPIYVGFFYYIYNNNPLHPSKLEELIENEIAIWCEVYKQEKSGSSLFCVDRK